MNATETFKADHSWSRRCSTETVYSIQGKETDYVCDTSDTDTMPELDGISDDEFEPVTEPEDKGDKVPVYCDTSEESDDIISTKVIEVPVGDDIQFADSECTDTYESDSEIDLCDYWNCAQCGAENNNPIYRYCEKCFQIRKNFFPPRPKRRKRDTKIDDIPRTFSQDSGVYCSGSQEIEVHSSDNPGEGTSDLKTNQTVAIDSKKRRAISAYRSLRKRKRISRTDSDTDLCSDDSSSSKKVKTLVKTISNPSVSIEDVDVPITEDILNDDLSLESKNTCVICITEPKSGVFVHGRIAHICCCYKCAMKVWAKSKRCPVCNCKVSNVLKAVVM